MAERKKPAEPAGYVKAKDVAELLDITIQRVGQLRKEGIFKQYKTPAGDRYQLVETVKAYIRYLRSQNSGKGNPWEDRKAEYSTMHSTLPIVSVFVTQVIYTVV